MGKLGSLDPFELTLVKAELELRVSHALCVVIHADTNVRFQVMEATHFRWPGYFPIPVGMRAVNQEVSFVHGASLRCA